MAERHRDARATATGAGRVLVAVYGIFALSATARAAVQIATKFDQAPLAYLLSALAGVVYILATAGLASTRPWSRPLAWTAVAFELAGVLVVGTLTVLDAGDFPTTPSGRSTGGATASSRWCCRSSGCGGCAGRAEPAGRGQRAGRTARATTAPASVLACS